MVAPYVSREDLVKASGDPLSIYQGFLAFLFLGATFVQIGSSCFLQRLAQLRPLDSQLRDKVCYPGTAGKPGEAMVPLAGSDMFCGRLTVDYIHDLSAAPPTSFCPSPLALKPHLPTGLCYNTDFCPCSCPVRTCRWFMRKATIWGMCRKVNEPCPLVLSKWLLVQFFYSLGCRGNQASCSGDLPESSLPQKCSIWVCQSRP